MRNAKAALRALQQCAGAALHSDELEFAVLLASVAICERRGKGAECVALVEAQRAALCPSLDASDAAARRRARMFYLLDASALRAAASSADPDG